MEPVCEEFMIHIINRLLQGDYVPLSCNLFFSCAFFATSRSWIPVVYVQPLLNVRAFWHVGIKEINIPGWSILAFVKLPHDTLRRPFEHQPYTVLV